MKTVQVYEVDYVRKTKRPIGFIEERRKSDRPDNLSGLVRLARRKYAGSAEEAFRIVVNPA